MTRLSPTDIDTITRDLESYSHHLVDATGYGLFDIACQCHGLDPVRIAQKVQTWAIDVIPITAGLGVISEFSNTVAGILQFLGFDVKVSIYTDVTGISHAAESEVDGIFMADDDTFMAMHCSSFVAIDNSDVTGRMYGTVLELMAGSDSELRALVIGCGPVGVSAAKELLRRGKSVRLFDRDKNTAEDARKKINQACSDSGRDVLKVKVMHDLKQAVMTHDLILDATPAAGVIKDAWLSSKMKVAIPGVPSGVSEEGAKLLGKRLVHDKLELGVAGMAVGLLSLADAKGSL